MTVIVAVVVLASLVLLVVPDDGQPGPWRSAKQDRYSWETAVATELQGRLFEQSFSLRAFYAEF